MQTDLNLQEMNREELTALSKRISKALDDYDSRKKAEARAATEALAKELGYSLTDLVTTSGPKVSKGIPKYAHPENPEQTWTGRGRKPKWVAAHISSGGDLDDLAIAS